MKNLQLLIVLTVCLVTFSEAVSINFRNYTGHTAGVATPNAADRTKLQQQQLQQQLQAVAAAAAAQQKLHQQQNSIQQAQTPAPAPPAPAISTTAVTSTQQQQKLNALPNSNSNAESENENVVASDNDLQLNPKWCQVHVFKKSRVTWLEAYKTCRSIGNGTELASIKTEEDYRSFSSKVKEAGSPASVIYWTSGTDLIDEGEFVWMSDGTYVTQTYWGEGQPDNHWESEHCIALKRYPHEINYKMTDENCLMAGAFICTQPCKFWV